MNRLRRLDPTEGDTLRVICDYLDVQQRMGKLLYVRHQPPMMTSKRKDGKTKVILKKERESQLGAADLIVFRRVLLSARRNDLLGLYDSVDAHLDVLCIEVKSAKGQVSPAQSRWCGLALDQGCRHIIARSLDDVISALR